MTRPTCVREVSKELHQGRLVGDGVKLDESKRITDHAAAYRSLIVRDAERLDGQFKGEVVAVSAHHVMLQVGDMVAVRYERANLDRGLSVGDRVTIQYDQARRQVYERGKEPARDRVWRDIQMGRERLLAPR